MLVYQILIEIILVFFVEILRSILYLLTLVFVELQANALIVFVVLSFLILIASEPFVVDVVLKAKSPEGNAQIMDVVADYMENARIIREGLQKAGYTVFGGINAPYIWLKVPHGDSWRFYDELLSRHHIIGTPGEGFGAAGEGYFRMTAFATRENTLEAMERIQRGSL